MFPEDVEIYSQAKYADHRGDLTLIIDGMAQDLAVTLKRSRSQSNVFRGMHYQSPKNAQKKIIEVIEGEIIDFLIDMRPTSTEFGKLYSVPLEPGHTVIIPEHYSHGFFCKTDTIFQYLTLGKHSEEDEVVIRLEKEQLLSNGIDLNKMIISAKDLKGLAHSVYFSRPPENS